MPSVNLLFVSNANLTSTVTNVFHKYDLVLVQIVKLYCYICLKKYTLLFPISAKQHIFYRIETIKLE